MRCFVVSFLRAVGGLAAIKSEVESRDVAVGSCCMFHHIYLYIPFPISISSFFFRFFQVITSTIDYSLSLSLFFSPSLFLFLSLISSDTHFHHSLPSTHTCHLPSTRKIVHSHKTSHTRYKVVIASTCTCTTEGFILGAFWSRPKCPKLNFILRLISCCSRVACDDHSFVCIGVVSLFSSALSFYVFAQYQQLPKNEMKDELHVNAREREKKQLRHKYSIANNNNNNEKHKHIPILV